MGHTAPEYSSDYHRFTSELPSYLPKLISCIQLQQFLWPSWCLCVPWLLGKKSPSSSHVQTAMTTMVFQRLLLPISRLLLATELLSLAALMDFHFGIHK